jgi:hypothetical protein
MSGCILISRKLVESEIWKKPPLYIKVWLYLLIKAQHTDYKGLKRVQVFTSIPEIQEACSWYVGYRKETPSKSQIYKILEYLRNPHEGEHEGETNATMITTTKSTRGIVVNIENYNVYQDLKTYESNTEHNAERPTKEKRKKSPADTINKNDKNVKNVKNIYGEFQNVKLTDAESEKLKASFPDYQERIERLSAYIASTGKKYKSHYATILNWARKDNDNGTVNKPIDTDTGAYYSVRV